MLLPALALGAAVLVTFSRVFWADFITYDDDIHVYSNPFLNPVSWESLGQLWQHAYKGLYIPLAYTIFAAISEIARVPWTISSVGQAVTLSPGAFHVASVIVHMVNVLLCFLLFQNLTRSRGAALLGSSFFAVHPLQVESVAWISELRGLSSACFALAALNLLLFSRRAEGRSRSAARTLFVASTLLSLCAMLCKPSAVVLPLIALCVDRAALHTPWRRSITTAATSLACLLPLALVTRLVQHVYPEGASAWWQRPFIAGDALVFYLLKTVFPTDLCAEYGRTPHAVMSGAWIYAAWALPAALMTFTFLRRKTWPLVWLGALMFVIFLLPTLGLAPFSFQAHSTVADRYAYLPMLAVGLIMSSVASGVRSRITLPAASAAIVVLAVLAFNQSGYWQDNLAFMHHIVDVNPDAAFAQINLGGMLLKDGLVDDAIDHLGKGLDVDPRNAVAQNDLALALVRVGRVADAEPHYRQAVELNPRDFKAYENLGQAYLLINRPDAAITSLQSAIAIQPTEAKAFNDLGVAFMRSGRPAEGLTAFQRAVAIDPENRQYRRNVGQALMGQGRIEEARSYLEPAP